MSLSGWPYTFGADITGSVLSVALLSVYHLYLRQRVKRNPAYTVQAVNVMARSSCYTRSTVRQSSWKRITDEYGACAEIVL